MIRAVLVAGALLAGCIVQPVYAHSWQEFQAPTLTPDTLKRLIAATRELQASVAVRDFEEHGAVAWQLWLEDALALHIRGARARAAAILDKNGYGATGVQAWQTELAYVARAHEATETKVWEADHHALEKELNQLQRRPDAASSARMDEILEIFSLMEVSQTQAKRLASVFPALDRLIADARK